MITINTSPDELSNNSVLGVKYNVSSNALAIDLAIRCEFSVRAGSGGTWQNEGIMYATKNALGTFDLDLLNRLSHLSAHQKLIPTASGLYNLTGVLQFRVTFTELYANSVGIKEEYNPITDTGYFVNTYTNLNESIAQFTADSLNPNQRYFLTNWIEKPFSLSQTAPILLYFIYEGTDNIEAYIETITSDGNTGDTAPIGEPLVITNKLGCVAIMPQDIPTNTERFRVRLLNQLGLDIIAPILFRQNDTPCEMWLIWKNKRGGFDSYPFQSINETGTVEKVESRNLNYLQQATKHEFTQVSVRAINDLTLQTLNTSETVRRTLFEILESPEVYLENEPVQVLTNSATLHQNRNLLNTVITIRKKTT